MKKVLLSLAAAALALSASAQVSTRVVSVGPSAVQYAGAKKVAKIASNQRWAGLYSSDALGEYGIGIPNYPGDNKCAAYLSPTVMSGYVGKKIVGMRFGLCAALDNSRVFINSATGAINNVRIGDELFAKDVAAPNKGWNEVTLDQPITIEDATGFFVGFDYKQLNTTSGGDTLTTATPSLWWVRVTLRTTSSGCIATSPLSRVVRVLAGMVSTARTRT